MSWLDKAHKKAELDRQVQEKRNPELCGFLLSATGICAAGPGVF